MQPHVLSQLNERSVLRVLRRRGPSSRAEVTRCVGVSAPTVSKAVAALLGSGLLEECDAPESLRGRPAKRLRLATETAQVLGLVIDARHCQVVATGLDGVRTAHRSRTFPTPATYRDLLAAAVRQIDSLRAAADIRTLGLGISMPGLIDSRDRRGLLSPNVPQTDGQRVAADLAERTRLDVVLLQECHALCLAERFRGAAQGLDDFAVVDATTGMGLSIFTHGRLLTGSGGLAGELGHLPIQPEGAVCGCGRRGCLETLASDTALCRRVAQRVFGPQAAPLTFDALETLVREGLSIEAELRETVAHLSFALATVINLFNPTTIFVNSRVFDLNESLLERLARRTGELALAPSSTQCRIQRATGGKPDGAIAAVIEHLLDSRVPAPERELA